MLLFSDAADSDAKLLEEVAKRGNGRIYFAEDVMSLPRIFSHETIAVARSTFVEEKTNCKLGPDLALLGKLPVAEAPDLGGYNLLSAWRAQSPSKDRKPPTWSRCMERLRDAFMLNSNGAAPATIV